MHCVELPHLQLGARGVPIDFLFRKKGTGGLWEPVDVSAAMVPDSVAMFKRPGELGVVLVTLSIVDGPGGRMRYTTHEGFLYPAGDWSAQGFVLFPGTPTQWVPSEVVPFRVLVNIRPMSFLPVAPSLPVATPGAAVPDPAPAPIIVPEVEVL